MNVRDLILVAAEVTRRNSLLPSGTTPIKDLP